MSKRRVNGTGMAPSRASMSLNEQEVDALLYVMARLETFSQRAAIVPLKHEKAYASVREKFMTARGSITAAMAAKRAREGEAAQ